MFTKLSNSDIRVDTVITDAYLQKFRNSDEEIALSPFRFVKSETQSDASSFTKVWDGPLIYIPPYAEQLIISGQMLITNATYIGYAKLSLYTGTNYDSDTQNVQNVAYQDKVWTWSDISALQSSEPQLQLWMYQTGGAGVYVKQQSIDDLLSYFTMLRLVPDSWLAQDEPLTPARKQAFRTADENLATRIFRFSHGAVQTDNNGYTVIHEIPFFIDDSAKYLRLYGQMYVTVGGNTGYAKWRVKGTSTETAAQSTTATAYEDKTWTFTDLTAYANTLQTLELLAYQNGSAGEFVRVKADVSYRSRFSRA